MKTISEILGAQEITELAKQRFVEERVINHLEGWFIAKEIQRRYDAEFSDMPDSLRIAKTLVEVAKNIPLWISDYSVFAGTQDDAFARSYALIDPAFSVDTFKGYCNPVAVFGDIEPIGDITRERIDDLRAYNEATPFAKALNHANELAGGLTDEIIFFFEQVTGHIIPNVRPMLKDGIIGMKAEITRKLLSETDNGKRDYYQAMSIALDAALIFASRYADIAHQKASDAADEVTRERFSLMERTLRRVSERGTENLFEAIQSFIIIWQTMCIEQTPNPYAFSVGNADRIFEPYRLKENTGRELSSALFKHMLVFFNVADRSWAISQNLLVSGRDVEGNDMTNPTTYALMDAYYYMNLPQPILSVKLHKNTSVELYEEMGKFFFTPGCLTPSLFNDDSLFPVLEKLGGVAPEDLPDYSVAGCQESLIMGKDNGNTTNS